ncbi:uncharacterized protein LOC108652761 [Drosophila navojoa]|uniref:uncharacterized protein LOC108652761 n=1 Tax=Drosophila navojoa TaxID=7232 RepID=UPI000846EF79|nr:uncharacterized protein LOC108652761 [Drosophila navojoa]
MAFLEQLLNDAQGKHININRDRSEFTRHYNVLRDTIYKGLKAVSPFDKWLSGHKLGGSYGDNLKITKPDEFDLVIHLKFPENDRIIVKKDPRRPGNVILNMTEVLKILQNQDHNRVSYTHLIKLVSSKNELLEDKLQALITSAMKKVLNSMKNKINVDGNITEVVYKRCGPAHTMFIDTKDIKYSVDFVPAIKLNASQNILGEEELKYFVKNGSWEAIPKPLKPSEPNNVSFRASYYDSELVMLKDKHRLKEVIRFMKKFRDNKQNMSNMKSYFIKTVLLWQVKEKGSYYWRTSQLKDVLIEMLGKLKRSLATSGHNGKLPFFWDPKLDLFATLTDTQRYDMFNCITGVIYTLERADGNLTKDIDNCIKLIFSKTFAIDTRHKTD